MKKVLMLASTAAMIHQFNRDNIRLLQELGYGVDVACNFKEGNSCTDEEVDRLIHDLDAMGIDHYQIDFSRSIVRVGQHFKAYKQVKKVLSENRYAFVHCHSPIGGAIARLAGGATKTPVMYTAHGLHFFKGAPLVNWLVYYPAEWICSHFTDTLITINKEDYERATKRLPAKQVKYVPGVGIDLQKFNAWSADGAAKRAELNIPQDAKVLLSVGELNVNKNHQIVIRAIRDMDVYYVIAGMGGKREELQAWIDANGMTERVRLLGFRQDVRDLYGAADVFVFPSFREGLSLSLMEAMACGKPCAVSRIRGNVDLIDEQGGVLFDPRDVDDCREALTRLLASDMQAAGKYNSEKITQFSSERVHAMMREIYESK